MSHFIHGRENLATGDAVQVDCDTQCNVLLLNDTNFAAYKRGEAYNFYGGFFTHFPASITAPHAGYWNVVIDLGGGRATIRYTITVLRA